MIAIRHRYNNSNVILNGKGLVFETKALCKDRLPARIKNYEPLYKRFGGFFNADNILNTVQRVKLIDINAFTQDEDGLTGWIDIPKESYIVGVYMHDRYYVLLKEGEPIVVRLQN
ncbi:hypothetical protein VIBNISOn1_530009 [Vibrio nigripulchritudo SOn1]|uniref:Uncharacterized protein n=1 Tax=Vibrio nigripulchritudo SOn1 TaxID=1238450 RepID=A0AAV2VUU7_9VIBR|nr:hypothetical protein [Vibrio nigripulchritudo]CCO48440.1 hypothetical protein VIBNISOn1_530009 [Vibrio nigripulchritudo SOn1]